MINFDDVVQVLKANKLDSWGVSVVSDTVDNVSCKIMYSLGKEELKNAEGEVVRVTGNIYFEGLYDISMKDRISFTDDFGNDYNLEILNIKPIKDFSNEILYTRVTV